VMGQHCRRVACHLRWRRSLAHGGSASSPTPLAAARLRRRLGRRGRRPSRFLVFQFCRLSPGDPLAGLSIEGPGSTWKPKVRIDPSRTLSDPRCWLRFSK
jgi:hypothetical protein